MSTNLFTGARKALVASIAMAALMGGVTVATVPYAAAATTVAAASVSTKVNAFTNTDWLNGVWRTGAGFSIPATAANQAAFKAGASVRLADGQVRTISRAQVVGSNMSVFLDGAKLDGNKVGAPQSVATVAAAPAPSPAPSAPSTTNGKPLLVGVNLSGAGFGPSVVPGTHGTNYTYPAESYYKKYADLGMPQIGRAHV